MSLAVTAVGMFLVGSPIGNLPIYLSFTSGNRREDLAIARSCALTVAITLLLSDRARKALLRLFGISVGAFQAARRLILLLIGLSMLRSQTSAIHHDPASVERDADSALKGVVPLGIPLIAGPGTIAVVLASPEMSLFDRHADALLRAHEGLSCAGRREVKASVHDAGTANPNHTAGWEDPTLA